MPINYKFKLKFEHLFAMQNLQIASAAMFLDTLKNPNLEDRTGHDLTRIHVSVYRLVLPFKFRLLFYKPFLQTGSVNTYAVNKTNSLIRHKKLYLRSFDSNNKRICN